MIARTIAKQLRNLAAWLEGMSMTVVIDEHYIELQNIHEMLAEYGLELGANGKVVPIEKVVRA